MDSRSSQSSEFLRVLQAQSLPELLVEPADFLRTYEKIKEAEGEHRTLRLEHLKRARFHTIDDSHFDKALQKLEDVLSCPRYFKQYSELKPLKPVGGLLEPGEALYFNVQLRGYPSPLSIDVNLHKGSASCYFSYRSLKPGPDIYDFRFRAKSYKIYGRYSVFKEAKGVLCILAERNTHMTIAISFGEVNDSLTTKSFHVQEEGCRTPIVRMPSLPAPSVTPSKDRSVSPDFLSQTVNFIDVNKRTLLRTRSQTRILHRQRQQQVKERRAELYQASKNRAIDLVTRVQRREEAKAKGRFITEVMERKERFEKSWITFITFASYSQLLKVRFRAYRIAALRRLKESFNCKIVQRAYRKRFPGLDIKARTMIYVAGHIQLSLAFVRFYQRKTALIPLFNCLRDSYKNQKISLSIFLTFNRIIKIQRNFRLKKYMEKYYFAIIYDLWDKVVRDEEEKYMKARAHRKFLHIPESEKLTFIHLALQESKERHKEFHKDGMRRARHLFSFLPKPMELLDVIMRTTKRKGLAKRLARKSILSLKGSL